MADGSVLGCEELINFTAGEFALKPALTRPPPEHTTCPGFTLGRGHSCRVPSGCIVLHHEYVGRSSLLTGEKINAQI